jgi:hypothetical protein
MLPFSQHAALLEQYENFTGGGTPLALLLFNVFQNGPESPFTVPLTHTKIDASFILSAGRSSDTTIERVEFRASLVPCEWIPFMLKGTRCSLTIKPGADPVRFQLWDGGLVEGGEVYRFMLADENFHA